MIPGMLDISRDGDGSRVTIVVKSGEYRVVVMLTPAQAIAVVAEIAQRAAEIVHELGSHHRELTLIALNQSRAAKGLPPLDALP